MKDNFMKTKNLILIWSGIIIGLIVVMFYTRINPMQMFEYNALALLIPLRISLALFLIFWLLSIFLEVKDTIINIVNGIVIGCSLSMIIIMIMSLVSIIKQFG